MIVYLADLIHNYYKGLNTVPLNVAYVAAYAKKHLGSDIEFTLFKYCEPLLEAVARKSPTIVGFSNYSWNESLNDFAGRLIKQSFPETAIAMGGPNIRNDPDGIRSFLEEREYVDVYISFEGEIPFTELLTQVLKHFREGKCHPENIRSFNIDSCFSLENGVLRGRHATEGSKDLDYIPSPYTMGVLDTFLVPEFIPLFESNRGCPYTCSYCTWGSNARKRVNKFSRERLQADMEYVAKTGRLFYNWTFADANFGILPRDVEIARDIRAIYEKYHSFQTLTIWWDKNAQKHMVEIAKILRGLSRAYIAFQTFDPQVEKLINRKNISIKKLLELSDSLTFASDRFHTDILLGLSGETLESHLTSLQKAFDLGFDSIGGGEIRLLKGSDLETTEARERDQIKTKYRLVQEGFGIYQRQFVAEFEESIRSTKWISEAEMINLRVLRAIFYGSITIGEFAPLMKYLRRSGVRVINLFLHMIEMKGTNRLAAKSIDWLFDKARNEWFDSKEEGKRFFAVAENRDKLLNNPVIKLNYDFLSYLLLSTEEYEAFYEYLKQVLFRHFPAVDRKISNELLSLCKTRNYIVRVLQGKKETSATMEVSTEVFEELKNLYSHSLGPDQKLPKIITLNIKEDVARSIRGALEQTTPQIQTVSLLCQKFSIYLTPVIN